MLAAFRTFHPTISTETEIGNVILENFTSFEEPIPLKNIGLGDLSVQFIYLTEQTDPVAAYIGGIRSDAPVVPFALRDPAAAKRAAAARKIRVGQPAFRRLLINTYGPVCAFSGVQLEETLQAAHIQPYVDAESNHVGNGLLLRADMHVLFDLGLLTLTQEFCIQVAGRLKGRDQTVDKLAGTKAKFPNALAIKPSADAIDFHRHNVFAD